MSTANKVPLKSIASFSKGEQISGDLLLKDGEYPYLNGGINPSGMWNEYNVEADTVTVSEGGNSCGYVNYMDTPFWCGAHCYYLYDVKCDVKFLYHALKSSQNKLMSLRSGACMPNIKKKDLGEFELPEPPPLEIQREIAYNLDKVSEAIELCRKILERLDYLVKAKFAEMFGDIIHNEKNWPYVALSDVAEIKIGPFGSLLHKEDYVKNGHAIVNPSHIIDGKIVIDEDLTISDEKFEELQAYELKLADVVLGRRGEMGRCAIVEEKGMLCGTGSMIIRPNGKVIPYFLQAILSSKEYKRILENSAVGVTMPNLNIPIVSSIVIPLFPMELQRSYTAFLMYNGLAKSAVKKTLETAQTLKNALMQKYFG